jgi:4-alpha-glucanotransferase
MTFGLPSWLKSRYKDLSSEVPVWYPTRDQPDNREWLITNGLGGYSSSTISNAHTRRYHGLLVSALKEPVARHIILSRVQEQLSLDGVEYDLSTNHWASGVVAPTGYRYIESFTTFPAPTWIYNINGSYLIKQIVLKHDVNELYIGYYWLPDRDRSSGEATFIVRFLTGFRDFHKEVGGSADKSYPQSIAGKRTEIQLEESAHTLQLTWDDGVYEPQSQWWWEYHWPEEASRDMPDREDLFLVGQLTAELLPGKELNICASLDRTVNSPSCQPVVEANLLRQNKLIQTAALPRSQETNLLILACDQFLVNRHNLNSEGTSVIAGYPWLNDAGRAAMISLPGLAVSTRRFDEAKKTLALYCDLVEAGVMANRFLDESDKPEHLAVDPTLWWAWALYHYYRATKDKEFTRSQLAALKQAVWHYVEGTTNGIKVDPDDGLVRCGTADLELTWMDAQVADIPITPRSGKPVDIAALWHNLLGTVCFLSEELESDADQFKALYALSEKSMQKFWNDSRQCLYDVLEPPYKSSDKPDDTVRVNQLLAVSLPFRAFTKLQEKSILTLIDSELLTPVGLRSLSPTDPSYQSRYGCGFSRADQYHRDLSYHQGTVWPWLIGAYCDALINVHGTLPETNAKIRILLQPLLNDLVEESCVGSISEIFDGNAPHMPHGCFAHSMAVAEVMRTLSRVLRS